MWPAAICAGSAVHHVTALLRQKNKYSNNRSYCKWISTQIKCVHYARSVYRNTLFDTIACTTSIHLSSVRRPLYSQYFHANYIIKSKSKFVLLLVSFIVTKNLMGFKAICTGILLTTFRGQLATTIFWVHEARRWRQNNHPPHKASYPRRIYPSTKYKCFWSLSTWPASPVIILLHSPNCTSPYPIPEEKKR